MQVEIVEYHCTFSSIATLSTITIHIVVATSYIWPLYQIDIANVFLHGYLD